MSSLLVRGLRAPGLGPIDLDLAPASCTALTGESGSGKSRLLRCLADLEPNEGEVWLGDVERASVDAPHWRRQVAWLPAESHWWLPTLAEHLRDAEPEWLERLRLGAALLGAAPERLSSGERQRAALLRVLALRPRVLLLDEPTANLDPANVQRAEHLVLEYLRAAEACALWVSHDPEQVRRLACRGLLMRDGQIHPQQGAQ